MNELSKSVATPTQKNALIFNTITEHVFSNKPQRTPAHLLGFGAMTRDAVQGSLMASSALSFQDILLNFVTRLRLVGLLFERLA